MFQENQAYTTERPHHRLLRRVPHSQDAEMALLGGLILRGCAVYERVSTFLRPDHFIIKDHDVIYRAIQAMIETHGLCDPIMVQNWFASHGTEDSPYGGQDYLVKLLECAASPINAEQYARYIVTLYLQRRIIDLSERMGDRAYDAEADDSARAQISEAMAELSELLEVEPDVVGFRDVGDILSEVFDQASDRIDRRLRGEPDNGVLSGIRSLDSILGGFDPGTVTLLAGRPSMGKSTVAANIAFNVAMAGTPVAFFTMEVRDDALVRQNIQARVTRLTGHKLRVGDSLSHYDIERARKAAVAAGIDRMPLRISHVPALTTERMRQMLLHEARSTKPGLVIVDYLQIMRASDKRSYSRNDEVSQLSRDIKAISVELDVPVLLLSQLSRAVELRDDKRPQLEDLRDSGSLEQDADNGIFVYREHYYKSRKNGREVYGTADKYANIANDLELIVSKQRSGPIGTAKAWFSGALSYVGDDALR